jgi:acetyl/propionyl-CoA carboxylase alpha subunit
MRHILRLQGQDHTAALTGPACDRQLLLDAGIFAATLVQSAGAAATLTLNDRATHLHIAGDGDRFFIHLDGNVYEVGVLEPLDVHASHACADTALQTHAPMPGSVVAIPVSIGDTVCAGDTLVVIESMKLEVSLKATQPGRVAAINCEVGATFEKDTLLIALSAAGTP